MPGTAQTTEVPSGLVSAHALLLAYAVALTLASLYALNACGIPVIETTRVSLRISNQGWVEDL